MPLSTSMEPASQRTADALLERHGFRAGQLFAGKYRLEGLLGEGGMGLVLLATHVDLQRTVAIKVVRSELASNDDIVERLLSEAQAAAQIRSEHVTQVLDLGRLESGSPYIVLEYLEGRDLAVVLDERGPLPIETAVDFVLQVCDVLAEAHAVGIIHRDLKPENLFLSERLDGSPLIKLIDFGISKNLRARNRRLAQTNPAELVGSPYYMAPEQMRGSRSVDGRADIWALGVVLYELCTGQTPFAADSIPAVCHLVMNESPTPPRTFAPDLPEELEAIIARCLEKNPDARFADISEFAAALAPFGSPDAQSYAERALRVQSSLRPSFLRERAPGGVPSEAPHVLDQATTDADAAALLDPPTPSWRTPPPLAATRKSSLHALVRSGRKRRRRRSAWLTVAAGLCFASAAIAAVVVLPSRFRVDPTAADFMAMQSLREQRLELATAAPGQPAEVAAVREVVKFTEPAEPSPSAVAPEAVASAAKAQRAPARRSWLGKVRARPTTDRPVATVKTPPPPVSVASPATASATASAAQPAATTQPSSRANKRAPLDAWDHRSFGGRR
jgi:eukaryotic-like serine/threonine-protein kinase